jgi:hypothetical protein
MKEIFNAKRFGKLFYKHTTEHYKSYLMSLVVLLGIMVLGGGFLVYMVNVPVDEGFQAFLFMSMLLLSGTIFTSTVFADLGDKKKAIAWLTLPATHFEKYMVAWIYSAVIFLGVYTASFYAVILVVINLQHYPGHYPQVFNLLEGEVAEVYLLYFFLHGIALWGAIFFTRMHFVKTAFAFLICFAALVMFNKIFLGQLLGRVVEAAPPFGSARIYEGADYNDIGIAAKQQNTYMVGVLLLLALLFWAAAFFRLKEKQA